MVKPTEWSQHLKGAAVKDGNCPLYQRQGGKRMHGMSPQKSQTNLLEVDSNQAVLYDIICKVKEEEEEEEEEDGKGHIW